MGKDDRKGKESMPSDKIELPAMGLGAREITLEITPYCPLHCIHCYGDFGKEKSTEGILEEHDWMRVLEEAKEIGTTNIQISGGEPATVTYLNRLIRFAKVDLEFPKVKLYTSAFEISTETMETLKETDTLVKVTFFSFDPKIHDAVTRVEGSYHKTSENIRIMYDMGVRLRAGIVLTPVNSGPDNLERTIEYLNSLGIQDVRHDDMHSVGRAKEISTQKEYKALCGNCWTGKLAIESNGYVHPCVMSRFKTLGNVMENSLVEIMQNPEVMKFRRSIYHAFVINK